MQHHKKVPQARLSQGLQPQKPPPQKNAPLSAAVESDIVGYTQIELKEGLNLVACSFEPLQASEGADIQDFLKGAFEYNDTVLFYGPSGYTTYYYTPALWGKDWEELGIAGWGDANEQIVSRQMAAGDAFWLEVKTAKTITIAGKVRLIDQTIQCQPGLGLVAVAFPIDIDLSKDVEFSGFTKNDQLMVYADDGNYETYSYSTNLYDSEWNETGKPGWGDLNEQAVEIKIPRNTSFWVSVANPATITIKSPLSK